MPINRYSVPEVVLDYLSGSLNRNTNVKIESITSIISLGVLYDEVEFYKTQKQNSSLDEYAEKYFNILQQAEKEIEYNIERLDRDQILDDDNILVRICLFETVDEHKVVIDSYYIALLAIPLSSMETAYRFGRRIDRTMFYYPFSKHGNHIKNNYLCVALNTPYLFTY